MKRTDCFIIVDLQNDFCPGGALAVPSGDEIVAPVNKIMGKFPLVVTTQDWHPPDHCSFKAQGGPWPSHCVQNTKGAKLHPELDRTGIHLYVYKGTARDRDAYSGFQGTELNEELKAGRIKSVFIAGLATDYCVKETALDALKNGFEVAVLTDLVRGIERNPGDIERALSEIETAGGQLQTSAEAVTW